MNTGLFTEDAAKKAMFSRALGLVSKRVHWMEGGIGMNYPVLQMEGFETPEQRHQRMQLALAEAKAAAEALRTRFGVQEVYLFGSLLDEASFGAHSDIDLAVRGMSVDAFYRANSLLLSVIKDFDFDLVDLNVCKPVVLESILQTGVRI